MKHFSYIKICNILLIVLFVPILMSAKNNCQYYRKFELAKDSFFLKEQGDTLKSLVLEVRLSVSKNKERFGYSKSNWKLLWNYTSENNYKYIELKWRNTNYGDILDQRQLHVNIGEIINGNDKLIKSIDLDKGVNLYNGENTVLLEVDHNKYNVFVGEEYLRHIGTFSMENPLIGMCGLWTSEQSQVSKFMIKPTYDITKELITSFSEHKLFEKFKISSDIHEGFWSYLDRDNDPDYARLGGSYRLALIENDEGYLIIYISGAQTNLNNWVQGMIKGKLIPTIFENHYDLVWYDSMFDVIDLDAHASIKNSILTLEFPIYKTQIRFYKEIL